MGSGIATANVPRLFWRERWRQASSAERYLQDAAASTVLASLPAASRAQVEYFSAASDYLVARFVSAGPAAWPCLLAAARQILVIAQGL